MHRDKCVDGIMRSENLFREPAAGVSRCESGPAVSCPSRLPEGISCVGRYGSPVTKAKRLNPRVLMSGRFTAIQVVPRFLFVKVVPEIHFTCEFRGVLCCEKR